MSDTESADSPLESVSSVVGDRTVEAFEILGNETRLAILLALWDAQDPERPPSEQSVDALAFSELYDRVGYDDTGNFNYHLDALVGPFVREIEEGYALTTRAEQILHAILAGTLADPPSFEGEPIDAECYQCESQVVVDYVDNTFVRRCTECDGIWGSSEWSDGTLVAGYRPPAALENRTPGEWNRDCNVRARNRRATMMEGVCPDCAGSVSATIYVCEDHHTDDDTVCERCGFLWANQSQFVCGVCKFAWVTPAWGPIFTETAVIAFFHDHGLDPRDLFETAFYTAGNRPLFDAIEQVSIRSEDPMELTVSVAIDGDRLMVILDDDAQVVDVTEPAD